MKRVVLLLMSLAIDAAAQAATPKTGPEIGARIPALSAPDQDGRVQSLATIAGPKGAMLVFFRSADW